MIGKEIVSKKPVPLSEVSEILEKRKKENEELGYEQELAYEHAKKFSKIDAKKAKKLIEKLDEIKKLSDETKIKIAEIMPINEDTIRQIIANEPYNFEDAEIKKIMEILNEFR